MSTDTINTMANKPLSNDLITSATVATAQMTLDTQQQEPPPLLALPAEVQNYIFELSMPTHTTICLRAENVTTNYRQPRFRLHPSLPPLYSTCKQIRAAFPIAQYYKNNTFLITDNMLRPGAMSAFLSARQPVIKYLARVRISHSVGEGREREGWYRTGFPTVHYIFDVKLTGLGEVFLEARKAKYAAGRSYEEFSVGICTCTMGKLVQGGTTIVDVLSDYADAAEACKKHAVAYPYPSSKSLLGGVRGEGFLMGRLCVVCGKEKYI